MTLGDAQKYVQMFFDWLEEYKSTNNFDEEKFLIIASGLDDFWQETCKARQLSLSVLKHKKQQDELDEQISNYEKLDILEQVLHNVKWFKDVNIIRDYIDEFISFDIFDNFSINQLEESVAKGKVITSLIEIKNRDIKLPLYKSYINFQEQVLNLKRLSTQSTLVVNESNNKKQVLFDGLSELDFWNLPKTKSLSRDKKLEIIDLFVLNGIPYTVAMFEYIGFFKHLTNEHGFTNSKIHSKMGSLLETSVQAIKGNMLSLNDYSKIDKTRYTAHLHKEIVKTDYYSLK